MNKHIDPADESVERQKSVSIGLYPSDIDAAKQIKANWKLDSFSQVIRRLIRDAVEALGDSTNNGAKAA